MWLVLELKAAGDQGKAVNLPCIMGRSNHHRNNPSANPNPNSTDFSDERLQMELLEWLKGQETWHKNRGRDHVFACQDPNAMHTVINQIKNSILLVSDFGRLEPDQGSWWKDVVLPYSHRIPSYVKENVTMERKTLLFFMGNRYRKEVWAKFHVLYSSIALKSSCMFH